MITEKLTKLDRPKRISAAIITVLVVGYICYFAITRNSVVKLKAADAKYASIEAIYDSSELQQAGFSSLQKQFDGKLKQLQEYQQRCFGNTEAAQFFENINSMALAHSLRPISRTVSEPKELIDNKADNKEPKTQQQSPDSAWDGEIVEPFLKTQSAKVVVSGNYFDIVDFVDELVSQPQKVYITNLDITLEAGEGFNPKAYFKVTILIDLSKEQEQ